MAALRLMLFWDGGIDPEAVKLYRVDGEEPAAVFTQLDLSALEDLTITKRRPCFAEFYDGYVLISNFWNQPVVVVADGVATSVYTAGLEAPVSAPSVTNGGSGVLTAVVTEARITYAHELSNGKLIAESNASPNGLTTNLDVTDGSVLFSGLPTVSPGRPNRIYGYLGLEGKLMRQVFNIPFGASSELVNMSVATFSEQRAFPNNGISPRLQARTAPPEARYIQIYNKRMFYAMTDVNPFRFFLSAIDEPESVDPSDYFDEETRQTITGLGSCDGNLIVFARRAQSILRGWSSGRDGVPADMSFRQVHPSIGCVCHHSILNINGKLYYMAEDGLRAGIGVGGTRWLGAKTAVKEAFDLNPARFYQGIAINDSRQRCYIFLPYGGSSPSDKYVHYYEPADPDLGGTEAEMPFQWDRRTRYDTTLVSWRRQDNGAIQQLTGSSDALVRVENDLTNTDDDGDAYQKRWIMVPRHNFMDIPGGGLDTEGKSFDRIWVFMNCQDPTVTVNIKVWAGDERAYLTAYAPQRDETMADVPATYVEGAFTYTPAARAVWEYKPSVSGRGLTVAIEVAAPPVDAVWYGYTTWWTPGSSGDRAKTRV